MLRRPRENAAFGGIVEVATDDSKGRDKVGEERGKCLADQKVVFVAFV